uniref:Uncharacterized protein n=1 Tax=viral metagenome TaxID=1070528 RepID=A0A6C0FHA6_9ZZZZ|tara:strand:- start:157 stop:669 length:513 start_codon:yes stop_codon:yes gene_type:complete
MYRDTLILLVLKEIFKDPYLVNYIHDIVEGDEVNISFTRHKKKTEMVREDIQILYPGFMRTAIFENMRFNIDDDLEPGYSFYKINPLIPCGYLMNYDKNVPERFPICHYSDFNTDYNGVKIVNDVRKKSKYLRSKIILNRRNEYANLELQQERPISLWYDYETKIFSNLS